MEYRRLGRTGLEVSAISFGGLPSTFISQKDAIELINAAIDEGINYFDLDEGPKQFLEEATYRDSQEKIGTVLKERRKEVYVGVKTMRRKKSQVLEDIDKALNYIFKGTSREVIDIFQLAFIDYDDVLKEVSEPDGGIEAILEAKKQGLIDYTLVAGHNYPILVDAIKTGAFDIVEFPFNVIECDVDTKLVPLANEMDIGTIVMKPLGGGQFGDIAEAQLKWLLNKPVSTIIPGIKTIDELKMNIGIAGRKEELTEKEKEQLSEFAQRMGKLYCHRCGYCLPCPQGIRIYGLIDLLNAGVLSFEKKKKAYSNGIENNLLKPASDCVACGECVKRCPYDLPIPDIMKKVVEKFGK